MLVINKSYTEAVNLLTSVGKFHISLGLERITKILELLGNPQDKLNCIHVAGTNGKGSVCAIISSVLTVAGKKTGLYTSPHIFKYTERIQIDGRPISDEDFAKYVFEISKLADSYNIDLTEFEILTAVMFKYFADNNVDVVVLETGLGGRFDATNVIKRNLCSIIAHVDLDHTERLGNTIEKIAFEKSGIIKKNCPCIVCEDLEVYKTAAKEKNTGLIIAGKSADVSHLSLKGIYQKENLSLALIAIKTVFPHITDSIIEKGLENVKHPFRFQYFKDYNLIIDGAHNPNGAALLRQSLDKYYPNRPRRFIFGCLKNKDYTQMLNILFRADDSIYFYHFNNKNSCDIKTLQAVSPVKSEELTADTKIKFHDGHLNIICGSFYMIAELVKMLNLDILRNI